MEDRIITDGIVTERLHYKKDTLPEKLAAKVKEYNDVVIATGIPEYAISVDKVILSHYTRLNDGPEQMDSQCRVFYVKNHKGELIRNFSGLHAYPHLDEYLDQMLVAAKQELNL